MLVCKFKVLLLINFGSCDRLKSPIHFFKFTVAWRMHINSHVPVDLLTKQNGDFHAAVTRHLRDQRIFEGLISCCISFETGSLSVWFDGSIITTDKTRNEMLVQNIILLFVTCLPMLWEYFVCELEGSRISKYHRTNNRELYRRQYLLRKLREEFFGKTSLERKFLSLNCLH